MGITYHSQILRESTAEAGGGREVLESCCLVGTKSQLEMTQNSRAKQR
jgi:hypothetical protein